MNQIRTFHYAEFILRKIFNAGKYEPNKDKRTFKKTPAGYAGAEVRTEKIRPLRFIKPLRS